MLRPSKKVRMALASFLVLGILSNPVSLLVAMAAVPEIFPEKLVGQFDVIVWCLRFNAALVIASGVCIFCDWWKRKFEGRGSTAQSSVL